jgi:hypothetical protein
MLPQEYSTESLSETQRAMLEDLRDYGLIWQRKAKQPFCMKFCGADDDSDFPGIVPTLQSNAPCYDPDILSAAFANRY